MSNVGFRIPGMTSCGCGPGGGCDCDTSERGRRQRVPGIGHGKSLTDELSKITKGFAQRFIPIITETCHKCDQTEIAGTQFGGGEPPREIESSRLNSSIHSSVPRVSETRNSFNAASTSTHQVLVAFGILFESHYSHIVYSAPHSSIVNYLFPNTHRPWHPRDYVVSTESLSDGGRSILKKYSERDCPPAPGTKPCIPIVSFGGVWIDPCTGCPVVADWANETFAFVRADPLLTQYLQTWIRPIPWTDRRQPWWPQNWPKGTVGPCPPFSPGNTPGDGWCSEGHSPEHCNLECFRSVGSNPGQQCCYDSQGRLVSNAPCAGTVDFSPPTHHEDAAGNCVPGRSTDLADQFDQLGNYSSILIRHFTVDYFEWWRNKFRYDQIQCCIRNAGIPSGTSTGGFVTREELQRAWGLCVSRYDNGELFCSNWYRP